MKTRIILFLFFISVTNCFCQNRNSVWCFGDSAGIDFSGVPISINTSLDTRGSCVSIADSSGQLQFYANTRAGITGNTTLVWNKNHQLMQNGDSIVGEGWYNELVMIPFPDEDSLYYLFCITVNTSSLPALGLYYSIIDLSQNSGLGAVTQKNIQLQNFQNVDCLNAIKHGNGRDWWIIFRKREQPFGTPNFEFYQYLITPSGLANVSIQNLGSGNTTGLGKITFSPVGDKMVFNNYAGMIELYDYDRCTGTISNPVNIFPENSVAPSNHFWGCEFSPNGNILYITISDQTSYLFQFDLLAPNITLLAQV